MTRVDLGKGNRRVEAIRNEIKVTIRMDYGFRNAGSLVAFLILRCSDSEPWLPGRLEKPARENAA